jgi:hypothetical protein
MSNAVTVWRPAALANLANFDAAADAAEEIGEDHLTAVAEDWSKVMAGEVVNAKRLYLIGTSRLLPKPMNVVIKGPSSAGKSELRRGVLKFFPPSEIIACTAASEKSLLYNGRDFRHKIVSMAEAVGGRERNFQDLLLRELMSEGRISYDVVGNTIVGRTTETVSKEGPVSFWVTTTKGHLHHENETRMLSLEVSDCSSQTKAVMRKIAEMEEQPVQISEERLERYHRFQFLLRLLCVEDGVAVRVPYAQALAELIPPLDIRQRRDFSQLLSAIKAHALLHCNWRDRTGNVVHADIKHDYAVVRGLMADLLAEHCGAAISDAMRETVEAAQRLQAASENEGVTAEAVAQYLGLDASTAWRRLQKAEAAGLIMNLQARRHRPGLYRAADTASVASLEVLPTPQRLERAWRG